MTRVCESENVVELRNDPSLNYGRKPIYGRGINDCPNKAKGNKAYSKWSDMFCRSYSDSLHLRRPWYKGCSVDERWWLWSTFNDWLQTHDDWENCDLDKDLIVPDNKVYGPDTCSLLPQRINKLIRSDFGHKKREVGHGLPNGVTFVPRKRVSTPQYIAWGSRPPKRGTDYTGTTYKNHEGKKQSGYAVNLGAFHTAEEAHKFAQDYKKKQIESLIPTCDPRYQPYLIDHVAKYYG